MYLKFLNNLKNPVSSKHKLSLLRTGTLSLNANQRWFDPDAAMQTDCSDCNKTDVSQHEVPFL